MCKDYATTQMVAHLFNRYFEDAVATSVFGSQIELLKPSATKPDPSLFGCSIIPRGTRMLVQIRLGVPWSLPKLVDTKLQASRSTGCSPLKVRCLN